MDDRPTARHHIIDWQSYGIHGRSRDELSHTTGIKSLQRSGRLSVKMLLLLNEPGYMQFFELKMPVTHQPLAEIDFQGWRNNIIAP
jgi:hypothetical protein